MVVFPYRHKRGNPDSLIVRVLVLHCFSLVLALCCRLAEGGASTRSFAPGS
jgi:hypothetical protein